MCPRCGRAAGTGGGRHSHLKDSWHGLSWTSARTQFHTRRYPIAIREPRVLVCWRLQKRGGKSGIVGYGIGYEGAPGHERPRLAFGPDLVKLIAEIDEFKGRWEALKTLSPDRLSAVATIESVGSSTRIEGAKLSDAEVRDGHHLGLEAALLLPAGERGHLPAGRATRTRAIQHSVLHGLERLSGRMACRRVDDRDARPAMPVNRASTALPAMTAPATE